MISRASPAIDGHGGHHCRPPSHSTWTGCVVDRGNDYGPSSGNYDTNVVAPTTSDLATLYVAEDYSELSAGGDGAQRRLVDDEDRR